MLSIILNIVTIAIVILFYVSYGRPSAATPKETPPWYWTASDAMYANSDLVNVRRIY